MSRQGASHHYFGKNRWAELAPGLKTIEDATEIRRRILLAFERAEHETDPARIRALLTFIVVGGGPTGVELAGALAEIARDTLAQEFRSINPSDARILLLEGADRILPYPTLVPSQPIDKGSSRTDRAQDRGPHEKPRHRYPPDRRASSKR